VIEKTESPETGAEASGAGVDRADGLDLTPADKAELAKVSGHG
jgi:hypothetical protein